MALTERLSDTPKRNTGRPCSIGALEDQLEGPELDALHAMLYQLGWSGRRVHDALTAEGFVVGQQQVNRNRSKACRCFA